MELKDEFKSSPEEMRSFINSTLHKDFVNELSIRILMLSNKLTDFDMEHSEREYDLFRGGIKNMEQMKTIFADMAEAKEADIREAQTKEEV